MRLGMNDLPPEMMDENDLDEYPVYCADCLAEGKKTVVGYTTVKGSHGICDKHVRKLRDSYRRFKENENG